MAAVIDEIQETLDIAGATEPRRIEVDRQAWPVRVEFYGFGRHSAG